MLNKIWPLCESLGLRLVGWVALLHSDFLERYYTQLLMPYNLFLFCFTAELFVNGEIVQRSPERQRRVEPVPQRASDRPRYNDRTRYARRRENQRWSDYQKPNNKAAWVAWGLTSICWMEQSKNCFNSFVAGIAIFHAGDSHIFGCIAFCNYWKTWKHLAWNALLLLNSSAMCTLVNQLDDFHSELHVVYSEFVLLCFLVKCYAWKCDCISWVRTHQWSLVENLWPQPNQLNFNFEV